MIAKASSNSPQFLATPTRKQKIHEMQTIVTDVRGVCLSRGLCQQCVWGSFGAAFAKSLWPLVITCKATSALHSDRR